MEVQPLMTSIVKICRGMSNNTMYLLYREIFRVASDQVQGHNLKLKNE